MLDREQFDRELDRLGDLAEAGYFLALHIRFTTPVLLYQTYNRDWSDHYAANGYVLRDPMTAWSFTKTGTTRWSDSRIPDPFGIFDEARRFGLRYGATVSLGPIMSRTVASLARSDREFTDAEMKAMSAVVAALHDLAEPTARLTKAQIEALKIVADGNRHAAAADMLGISESALKLRLAGARERLSARTTAEAIQRAKDYNLL
ncbi:transcriptional regulator, LuxR family [Oceaniovalibus guishaninsula JLT2003]|uniref:Transcriptional regulator, LuxR family n=1 Tax=Oceaniovalibus guishaninsula JLT2003 TaxID=1231392 RepID=K2H9W6_9RHOB|nr:autoinducer binding domain-containing protein [Oceaniovalibus guishaninsula]EKE43422.1 transcriptional regulator, LuxR family [Oceaniovalibus guishaninsula JLT2003]